MKRRASKELFLAVASFYLYSYVWRVIVRDAALALSVKQEVDWMLANASSK